MTANTLTRSQANYKKAVGFMAADDHIFAAHHFHLAYHSLFKELNDALYRREKQESKNEP